MHTLEATHLSKIIKKTKIISDISIRVQSGEVVGLLGPNGAGKTTTFYIICGLLKASGGSVKFDNNDPKITLISLNNFANKGVKIKFIINPIIPTNAINPPINVGGSFKTSSI